MKKADLDFFRALLEQQLELLLHQGGDTKTYMRHQEHVYSDLLDRASCDEEQSRMFRFRDRESYLIKKLRRALGRIDDGSFGFCEICEEAISRKRLLARPVATKCIKCKIEEERFEKAVGR